MESLRELVISYIELEEKEYEIMNKAKNTFFSDILDLNDIIKCSFMDKIKNIQNQSNELRNEKKSLVNYIFYLYYKVEKVLFSIDTIKKELILDDLVEDINKLEMQLNYVKKTLNDIKEMDQ
ncbi:hypothetical protein PNEG_01327 [Pneumocystis murina B123]|uniref:Uncharacterized protein n=1 Tax=Pneumocystis murina (strain B123) TaxID=1069680 RepID=M7PJI6_PNEMU|nr:hypothetical protein PNEG_01327 [Pneumocystis murina B123]EMR10624.1 hypothetical protein PNEG_01327 [Pneumocystis murina B123]